MANRPGAYREDFKKEIVGLYEFGFSFAELRDMTDIRIETLRAWVKQYKIPTRPQGQAQKLEITQTYPEIARLRNEEKMEWAAIGAKFGCSANAARHRYKKYRDAL